MSRADYMMIHLLEKMHKDNGLSKRESDKLLEQLKKDLRHKNAPLERDPRVRKVFFDSYCGERHYILLDYSDMMTDREAEDHFSDVYYIDRPYSPYDCTAQPFTYWHKIIHIYGDRYILHEVSLDI